MTHQINSKNRVMAGAWNSKKRYITPDPQISGENRDTVDF
jgi:hypothetical protein